MYLKMYLPRQNILKPEYRKLGSSWKISNRILGRSDPMTKELAPWLREAFKKKFDNSLEKWENYFKAAKGSSYLFNKKFNSSLERLLNFTAIDRIFAGEFGVRKASKNPQIEQKTEQNALDHIESCQEALECKEYRRYLLKVYGPAIYATWLSKLKLILARDEIVVDPESTSNFIRDYVNNNFMGRSCTFLANKGYKTERNISGY
jgi:hypothetical protein